MESRGNGHVEEEVGVVCISNLRSIAPYYRYLSDILTFFPYACSPPQLISSIITLFSSAPHKPLPPHTVKRSQWWVIEGSRAWVDLARWLLSMALHYDFWVLGWTLLAIGESYSFLDIAHHLALDCPVSPTFMLSSCNTRPRHWVGQIRFFLLSHSHSYMTLYLCTSKWGIPCLMWPISLLQHKFFHGYMFH